MDAGQPRVAADGGIWVRDRPTLRGMTATGSPRPRVDLPHEDGERVGSFLVLSDGFLVAWAASAFGDARVARTDQRGVLHWSTRLPIPDLAYRDVVQMRRETGWHHEPLLPWKPRFFMPVGEGNLLVAGDRLLATFQDPFSGLGVSYCLDLSTGDVVWTTPSHPTGERAVAGPGRFLIGAQGYGAFETYLYESDGSMSVQWPSHGRLLVSHRGRIRVIELENPDAVTNAGTPAAS
jgi:outer membrane protein assembly factor BamB